VLDLLAPRPGGVYVDATVGAGGHAEAILDRAGAGSRLIGIDRDHEALAAAADRLARFGPVVTLVHENFTALRDVLTARGVEAVDGIVMDLGISSLQLGDPERGFSFQAEGPLDMRMDRSRPETAADLVNRLSEEQIRQMLRDYGQERWAGRIARRIVRTRPLQTTTELADVVAGAVPRRHWPRRIHPATRTFQALRIAVNRELDDLEEALPNVVEGLRDGGRLCVITFHSLEDHIVKHTFLCLSRGYPSGLGPSTRTTRPSGRRPERRLDRWAGPWPGPGGPMDAAVGEAGASGPRVRVLTRRPVTPSEEEVARNPRARSAKLRAVERITTTS
jgi:16S rRNA (cytosine1402-N4)-methyltransferase